MMVLKLRLPPLYVLDEMTMYEFEKLLEYSHYAHQEEWEQCRFNSYVNVQMNTKKKLKPVDIIKFSWDVKEENKMITQEDKERIRELAKKHEQLLNNHGK